MQFLLALQSIDVLLEEMEIRMCVSLIFLYAYAYALSVNDTR